MISVIIPAYNEEKLIARCLDAFTKQTTTQPYEIILVDNNSTDNTVPIAKQFLKKIPLKILIEKRKGRGTARATGFDHAKGSLLLSTDADIIVPPDWIDRMTAPFEKKTIDAVTGTCRILDNPPHVSIFFNRVWQPAGEIVYFLTKGHWCLMGYNFAIRKSSYEKAGKFNAKLNCEEDADLSERVAKIGKIIQVPVIVMQSGRRFRVGVFRGTIPYIRNFIRTPFIRRERFQLEDIR